MSRKITITVESIVLAAELYDSESSRTFAAALPLEVTMSRWGEEYYGGCGLSLPAPRMRGMSWRSVSWPTGLPGAPYASSSGPPRRAAGGNRGRLPLSTPWAGSWMTALRSGHCKRLCGCAWMREAEEGRSQPPA